MKPLDEPFIEKRREEKRREEKRREEKRREEKRREEKRREEKRREEKMFSCSCRELSHDPPVGQAIHRLCSLMDQIALLA